MKQVNKSNLKKQLLISMTVLVIGVSMFSPSRAYDEYQFKVLFAPSAEMLDAEARGRVMIYDGLRYATVTRAMDEQFDRIENMMFVGTVIEQEDGELDVEEDGCD